MANLPSGLQGLFGTFQEKAVGVIDAILSPEKRQKFVEKIKTFITKNPKIAAFLLTNIALSGPPLVLFAVFTLTIFVFSLIFALLVALVFALLFTAFMLVVALVFVLPTVFITTMGASFLFLWGLGGYYIFKWFNQSDATGPAVKAIGDKLNTLTGGRLTSLMSGIRAPLVGKAGNAKGSGDEKSSLNGDSDATSTTAIDGSEVKKAPAKLNKRANVDGAVKKGTGAANSAQGVTSGVSSGLT